MNVQELVASWNNGWLASISEPYKDENSQTWMDVKFSRPTNTKPIPPHFVSVRFKIIDDKPVSYLIEYDRTEKPISYAISDKELQMYLRIKAKGGCRAGDIGL